MKIIFSSTHNKIAHALKQKGNLSLPALGILIFTIFIFTQRWFELYQQVRFLQAAVVGLALLLVAVGVFNKKFISEKLTIIDFLWFPGIAIILLNIFITTGNMYDLFIYTTGFAFLVLAKAAIKDYSLSFKFIKFGAVFYALGSIVQYFFTDSFNKFILHFASEYSLDYIDEKIQRNYYPGFGFNRTGLAAGYISSGLGFLLSFWDKKNKIQVRSDIIIFFILFFGLLITGKRSILLWTIMALPLTYFILGTGKERLKRLLKVFIVLSVGILLLFIVINFTDTVFFLTRIESLLGDILAGEFPPEGLRGRLTHYPDAWALFLEKPLFGVGWKQFRELTSGLYSTDFHVHNLYLQLLCETGIVGFTAVMIPLIYTYIKTYNLLKYLMEQTKRVNPLWKKGLAFSFYYQTVFLLYSLSDTPFYHNYMYLLLYFLAISMVNSFVIFERTD